MVWLNPLMLGFGILARPVVMENNQADISMIERPRTKKYKLRIDYIKDKLDNGDIEIN